MLLDTDLLHAHFLIIYLMNVFWLLSTAIHKNWSVKKTKILYRLQFILEEFWNSYRESIHYVVVQDNNMTMTI